MEDHSHYVNFVARSDHAGYNAMLTVLDGYML